MSTDDFVDNHFLCQLKMEEQINCSHTVKLTAPGLVIDKGGTVGTELTYSFAAGQGLTSQDVGIVGHSPGEYYLFADITSPYYVSANGLKVKKDKINIRIRSQDPDGWYGQYYGLHYGYSMAYGSSWVSGDLHYKYTRPAGGAEINIQCPTTYVNGSSTVSGSAYLKVVDPTGAISYKDNSNNINVTIPGVYRIYVYDTLYISAGSSPPNPPTHPSRHLGTINFRLTIGGVEIPSGPGSRRGLVREQNTLLHNVPINQPFSFTYGELLGSYGLQGLPYTITYPPGEYGPITSSLASPTAASISATGQYAGPYATAQTIIRFQKPLGGDDNLSVGIQVQTS